MKNIMLSEKHNAEIGGTKGSFHTKGLAADLSCSLGAKKLFVVVANLKVRGKPRSIFFEVKAMNFDYYFEAFLH